MMQALVTASDNTAVVTRVPIPEPKHQDASEGAKTPNRIRIKVHSFAVNPVDPLYVVHPADAPGRVVGSDIAGVVDKIGDGTDNNETTHWAVGDRVAGLLQGATSGNLRPGGFAEYAILEADLAIRIPSGVSFDEAATLPLCSLTAAQALFIRLEIPAPFDSPFKFPPMTEPPAILVYSAATSLGLFTVELAKALKTPTGKSYRVFATASPKNHERLRALGVDGVFDYRSPTWVEDVRRASGGITHAVDCISEDETTAMISQTFVQTGGKIAVIRKSAWNKEGVRPDVIPLYGAAWVGLGHQIFYNNETIPEDLSWRALTVAFFRYLSAGSHEDPTRFPITPNPVRLMPGGLARVVSDAFQLIGSGKVADRGDHQRDYETEPWMKPISAEKLVYRIVD